jgi:hypothetical protein
LAQVVWSFFCLMSFLHRLRINAKPVIKSKAVSDKMERKKLG